MANTTPRPGLRVALLGHARHGKSALASALTARAASRSYATRTRPIAFVETQGWAAGSRGNGRIATHETFLVESPMREYAGVDVTSHRRLVRHAGVVASSVDACVLVVSAVDGAMAQTREHALLARHLTPGAVVAFINRCDEVTDLAMLDLAEMEAREALYHAGFDGDGAVVVRGAAGAPPEARAAWAGALDDLLDALDHALADAPRDLSAPLCATVLHRWSRPSREGPVVELSVRQGELHFEGRVAVMDRAGVVRDARARMLRAFDQPVLVIPAGAMGTALLTFDAGQWSRGRRFPRMGDLVFKPGGLPLTGRLAVRLQMLGEAQGGRRTPARAGHEASVWLAGRPVRCRVVLPAAAPTIEPGDARDDVTLELATPTYVPPGATFVLRDGTDGRPRRAQGPAVWGGCFATGRVLAALGAV